jgi:hypothetical protein
VGVRILFGSQWSHRENIPFPFQYLSVAYLSLHFSHLFERIILPN